VVKERGLDFIASSDPYGTSRAFVHGWGFNITDFHRLYAHRKRSSTRKFQLCGNICENSQSVSRS
jgi:hypothetical protein